MEKRLTLILANLFLFVGMAFAQMQVTGTVVSQDDNEPVVGASIMVVGTNTGTVTDINGKFSLAVPAGKKSLRISYVGMEPVEVTASPSMRIELTSDRTALDEVIVVAFGTAKKSAFTGSATVINSEEITKKTAANVANALVGSVPGLQMTGMSGAPGAGNGNMYIRGLSSLYSSTDPLIIVDGAPYYASLTNINTDDIESVTVLKDAASAALYGAAGAAGVILVTTKKGTTQEAIINVDMRWGVNSRSVQEYDRITDPAQYYETYYKMMNNYYANALGYDASAAHVAANSSTLGRLGYNVYNIPNGQFLIGTNGKLNPNATLGRTYTASNGETYYLTADNWDDAAYSNALRQEYTVNISAGNTKSSFYASAGYLNEDGIIEYSDFERFTGRLKADYQAKKWLKVGANLGYTHSEQNSNPNMDTSWGATNLMYTTSFIAPIYPIYVRVIDPVTGQPTIRTDAYGHQQYDYGVPATNYVDTPVRGFMSTSNPLGSNRYNRQYNTGNSVNMTYTADVTFTDWLRFNSTNNINLGNTIYTEYGNPFEGPTKADNGSLTKYHQTNFRQDYIQTLNFQKQFGLHDLQVMLGHEWNKTSVKRLTAYARNGFSTEVDEISNFGDRYNSTSYTTEFNREGFFGSAMYNWSEKYFGQVSYRRDASSTFAKDHRWGDFWSVGGAWIISKESFMAGTSGWLDQLKIKASIGQQGNDGIGYWNYTNLYNLTRSGTSIVPSFRQLGNEDITWETTTNFNAGLEWSLWRGRFTGSFDFYTKKTTDLLFWLNIPESYGTRGYYANIGDIRNTGVELTLAGDIIRSKHIVWNMGLNISHNKAKILKLPESKIKENGGFAATSDFGSIYCWYEEGGDMQNAFIYEYAGIYSEKTWQLTQDEAYDPSKAGLPMYWGDKSLWQTDEEGGFVSMNTSKPATKRDYATTRSTDASRYAQGSIMPTFTGGFNTTLKVYDFDFSAVFDFQLGGKVFDSSYQTLMGPESGSSVSARIFHVDVLKAWTPENQDTDVPRFQYNDDYTTLTSTRFLTNASYLNFQSFSVGYTFPKSLTQKFLVNKLRLYVQGQNLCFWSKRKGFDPRYSFGETADTNVYSPVRTISGGVQVTF
jgi:TonB-linked SusC/RagA family outer membrane protein